MAEIYAGSKTVMAYQMKPLNRAERSTSRKDSKIGRFSADASYTDDWHCFQYKGTALIMFEFEGNKEGC